MDRGTYIQYEGRPAVRFRRTYPHPIERVWAALSRPQELARWFPSSVELELRPGGEIRFSGDPHLESMTGTVLVSDPPRHLAFTWGGDELHFELEADGEGGCRLTLTDVLEAADAAARNAAGWSVCLVELDRHLGGAASDGPHGESAAPWRPFYDDYVADGMPSGAEVPGLPS